jgi:hypothetical protein
MNIKKVLLPLLLGLFAALVLLVGFASASGSPSVHNAPNATNNGIIYVDADAPGPTHDGTSWTNAYATVQDALTTAISGTQIWVAEGVYYPDEGTGQTNNDRNSTFTLKDGVGIYGGFAASETVKSQRDWIVNLTILSGDIDKNDLNADGDFIAESWKDVQGNNAYHVVSNSGVTETAILDGFIVTAGETAGSFPDNCGGGMSNLDSSPTLTRLIFSGNMASDTGNGGGMCNLEDSRPTLTEVSFSGNLASNNGGGMFNSSSNPTLTEVNFFQNMANNLGGGLDNYQSDPNLTAVTFSANAAVGKGGGMFNNNSNPTLTNVSFIENFTTGDFSYGGGMYNEGGSPTLMDVTFYGNRTKKYGGGMVNYYSDPVLTNVAFLGNSTEFHGGGLSNGSSSPKLENTIFSGNTAFACGGMVNADGASPTHSNPTLTNVTFTKNTADYKSGGLCNWNSSSFTMTNVIMWGNTTANGGGEIDNDNIGLIQFSNIQGSGGTDGNGNIDDNPNFIQEPNPGDGFWFTLSDNCHPS